MNYGFVIDTGSCIGCHACSTACKSENQVPVGVHRTWVKTTEKGRYPDVTRHFQVTRCNHCANPPCVRSCPVTAMYQRDDGIVEFDPDVCIGCKACLQACPYDAIHIDPDTGTASKCHYCAHRVDVGQEPACVVVCPEHAIIAGDMDDPSSEISRVLAKQPVTVRKPEQGTAPKVFYIDGNDVALHPSAQPEMYMFSDPAPHHAGPLDLDVPAYQPSAPGRGGSAQSGAALRQPQDQALAAGGPVQVAGVAAGQMVQVGWNAHHEIPWHWPIPAYIVIKALAAGLAVSVMALVVNVAASSMTAALAATIALALMGVTNGLLLYDLERPERFLSLLTRPQWRSWVARAAWILTGFTTTVGVWTAVEWAGVLGLITGDGLPGYRMALAIPMMPLAVMTGIYTAFLFAQAEGRDFWQSAVTPIHMLLQTVYLGGTAALALTSLGGWGLEVTDPLRWTAVGALVLSAAVLLLGEFGVTRASELGARAQREIQWGRYRRHFWFGGVALGLVGPVALLVLSPALAIPALVCAGLGLFAYEYAFVMAPQALPNS